MYIDVQAKKQDIKNNLKIFEFKILISNNRGVL